MHSPLPYALGIHTTTPQLGLSVSHPSGEIKHQTWDLGRDMSTELHERLFSFISAEDLRQLAFIAVACGPGGFTSTRLGVVTARTLAQQLNIPLFGISSLAAYVWHPLSSHNVNVSQDALMPVHMPARRGQVFGAIYGINWSKNLGHNSLRSEAAVESSNEIPSDLPSSVLPSPEKPIPQGLVTHKHDHVLDAEEWQRYLDTAYSEPMVSEEVTGVLGYTVPAVLTLAAIEYQHCHRPHWASVQPFYGQSPV